MSRDAAVTDAVDRATPDADGPNPRMRRLDRRSVVFWQVENAVGVVALLVVAFTLSRASFTTPQWDVWIRLLALAALAFAVLDALVLIPQRYRYYRYALTEECIIIEQGRFWRRRQVYPLSRILYCEVRQGPILSLFNLYTVRAATIVESRSLGPLGRAEADRFEQLIREHPE